MDDESSKPAAGDSAAATAGDKSAEGGDGKEEDAKDKAKEKEPSSYTLAAPCRVVPQQVKHVAFPPGVQQLRARAVILTSTHLCTKYLVHKLLACFQPAHCGHVSLLRHGVMHPWLLVVAWRCC